MTLVFSERYNRFHAGKRLFHFFGSAKVPRKIYLIIWGAIIIAPSPIKSFELFAGEIKSEFVDSDLVFIESVFQDVNRDDHVQSVGLTELCKLWSERFSQLHARETFGGVVSKDGGKSISQPSAEQDAKKCTCDCNQRTVHPEPIRELLEGLAGIAIGRALGVPMVWLPCKHVWFS